jgi:glutathione S-transferase
MNPVRTPVFVVVCLLAVSAFSAELMPPETSVEQAINHYIQQRLTETQTQAARLADDCTLVRRTSLDLAGRIPTTAEVKGYAESTEADKRLKLVERLLASPDFAFQFRNQLDTLLMGTQKGGNNEWREYLLKSVRQNRPWDQMFRDMLVGNEDDPEVKPALTFVKSRAKDLDELTNDTCTIFFGVNVTCAKCHDHPLVSDWKQDHYFGMASFFQRTYVTKKNMLAEKFSGEVKFKTTAGVDKVARFMFLTGATIDEPVVEISADERKKQDEEVKKQMQDDNAGPAPQPEFRPRAKLVELALQPESQPFFAKSIVNRVWAMFLGRGLVHPLDQLHSSNPSSHPELLDWLTRDLIAHQYDLRRLARGIALSEPYARSSEWAASTEPPPADLFAVALVRPLSPRQYSLSLRMASAAPDHYKPDAGDEWLKRRDELERNSEGFANQFEQPGENFQIGVDEALLFSNSPQFTDEYLRDSNDRLVGSLKAQTDRPTQITTAYWATLSRAPSAEEISACEQYLVKRDAEPVAGLRQMVWALLTSPELRFNH